MENVERFLLVFESLWGCECERKTRAHVLKPRAHVARTYTIQIGHDDTDRKTHRCTDTRTHTNTHTPTFANKRTDAHKPQRRKTHKTHRQNTHTHTRSLSLSCLSLSPSLRRLVRNLRGTEGTGAPQRGTCPQAGRLGTEKHTDARTHTHTQTHIDI